jgi:hypothetical protein
MKRRSHLHAAFVGLLGFTPLLVFAQVKPIALYPQNPHYFLYKEKPHILITSGEHYGAVLNLAFDYTTYLDQLALDKLNLTRTFSGSYHEPGGAFNIAQNTLAPAPDKFICPWARSEMNGSKEGGKKFDLTRWDENYFERLKDFVSAAGTRGINVEFTFFCPFYEDTQWDISPMNSGNNINGVGNIGRNDVYTLDKNGGLLAVQETLVRKIVNELKDCSNLMYEICNEPYFGGVTLQWQQHIARIVQETEKSFPNRHLISQNIANGQSKIINPFEEVSVFNFHYAMPPVTVAMNYGLNRVIGDNETGFRGNSDSAYRMEAWRFILAGGGLFNNLDYSFTVRHERGDFQYPKEQPGGGSTSLRKQLGYLSRFMLNFNFTRMKPDSTTLTFVGATSGIAQTLSEPGKQYAIYLYRCSGVALQLALPPGRYELAWLNTLTGKYSGKKTILHRSQQLKITAPAFREDMALKILRKN